MKTKIHAIFTWYENSKDSGWLVAQAWYDNGNIVKYTNKFGDFPKTVKDFIANNYSQEYNSQVTVYGDILYGIPVRDVMRVLVEDSKKRGGQSK